MITEISQQRFQSLFYWKYHFNFKKKLFLTFLFMEFQSLFYWKYHFNYYIYTLLIMFMLRVSILVLLEVPLQRTFTASTSPLISGFNPCFTGSTTSTSIAIWVRPRKRYVSILVLLEVPLQRVLCSQISKAQYKFQSLFYWKYHFNLASIKGDTKEEIGFNPCFTGSTTSTASQIRWISFHPMGFNPCFTGSTTSTYLYTSTRPIVVLFQSLFYWKYHFNAFVPSEGYFENFSFNPCFTGSTTSTASIHCETTSSKACFNPCFTGSTTSTRTLLIFNECMRTRFNPCFTGSTTSTGWCSKGKFRQWKFQSLFYWKYHFNLASFLLLLFQIFVSILVLLEVPLQLTTSFYITIKGDKFQSLFYWKYHFNWNKIKNGALKAFEFQSLFYWKYHFNNHYNLVYMVYIISFNPCFTGSTTSTEACSKYITKYVRFQSLFYWKYHFNAVIRTILLYTWLMFQSLFYWKYHFNIIHN